MSLEIKAKQLIGVGDFYYKKQNFIEATKAYEASTNLDQPNTQLKVHSFYMLGQLARRNNDFPKAIKAFKQSIIFVDIGASTLKQRIDSLHGLAFSYSKSNKLTKALSTYKLAEVLDPKNAHTKRGMGNVYWAMHEDQAAIDVYTEAFELENDAFKKASLFHEQLCPLYFRSKQYDKFIENFYKITAIDIPDSAIEANLYKYLGDAHFAMENFNEAYAAYNTALEKYRLCSSRPLEWVKETHQKLSKTCGILGTMLCKTGNYSEASEYFSKGARLSGLLRDSSTAKELQLKGKEAFALYKAQRSAALTPKEEAAITSSPSQNAETTTTTTTVAFSQSPAETTLAPIIEESAESFDPENASHLEKFKFLRKLGGNCYRSKDYEKAAEAFGEALRLVPKKEYLLRAKTLFQLGMCLRASKQYPEAFKAFGRVKRLEHGNAQLTLKAVDQMMDLVVLTKKIL